MAVTRYTKMAYDCADDMVFGQAKQPVSYGFGLKIGSGVVIPEINYAPRPGTEKDAERLRKEYVDYISKDILNRAVTAGFPNVQLETEWVSQMGNPKMATPVVEGQKAICEKFHEEYGINCAVRQTIPDQREAEEGLRPGMGGKHAYPEALFQCAEIACENGADVLSCESVELRIDFVGAVSCDLAVCRSREFRFVGDGHLVGRGREVSVGIVDGVDKHLYARPCRCCGLFIEVEKVVVLVCVRFRRSGLVAEGVLGRGEGRAYGGVLARGLVDQVGLLGTAAQG